MHRILLKAVLTPAMVLLLAAALSAVMACRAEQPQPTPDIGATVLAGVWATQEALASTEATVEAKAPAALATQAAERTPRSTATLTPKPTPAPTATATPEPTATPPLTATPMPTAIPTLDAQCYNGVAVPDPEDNPSLVSDCAALLDARGALAGSSSLDWNTDVSITSWEGIVVGGSPRRVRELSIESSELTGEIPAELSQLTGLTLLRLSNNQLTGEIPPELARLTSLNFLILRGNKLTARYRQSLVN